MSILAKLLGAKQDTLTSEAAANESVRVMLKTQGDDGSATRHVRHYAYPKNDDASVRAELVAHLKALGFEVNNSEVENGLIMEHYRPVAGEDFDRFTADLRDHFAERGWDYDGWECAIVMPERAAS